MLFAFFILTTVEKSPEDIMVPGQGVAVPAVALELMLAFCYPFLHSGANCLHYFWMLATQLALLTN